MVAVCQARSDALGGSYYRKKKIAEGKSRKEALRCLKRRILRCRFQEPRGRFEDAFARRRLTKRSRERRFFRGTSRERLSTKVDETTRHPHGRVYVLVCDGQIQL